MQILDLFSGIGGMSLGFHRADPDFFKTVAFCEIDEHAKKVLNKNFPGVAIYDDVCALNGDELQKTHGRIDIITGGFPCQDLSSAGLKAGLNGERSGLFFEMTRLIREISPDFVLFENVKELLTNETYNKTFNAELILCGYRAAAFLLRASDFGYPHERKRAFILCWPEDAHALQNGRRQEFIKDEFEKFYQQLQKRLTISSRYYSALASRFYKEASQAHPDGLLCAPFRKNDGVSAWLVQIARYGNSLIPDIPELFARVILELIKKG